MQAHELARNDATNVTCVDNTNLVLKVPPTEKTSEQNKQFTFNSVLNEDVG